MTDRLSIEGFKKLIRGAARAPKYRNTKNVIDGIKFDSRLESDRYLDLKNLWHVGAIKWFTRQVPFQLPGGIVYRCDFLVVYPPDVLLDGGLMQRIEVEDCKGFMTRVSINKIKQVEAIYGIEVKIITKETRKWMNR